jgi:hypothetical protein
MAMWAPRMFHTCVALPDGGIVLMGGNDRNDVWRSVDYGATWIEMTASAEWDGRSLHSSVSLPGGDIVIMGGAHPANDNDVWHSLDNGSTWHQHVTGIPWWSARSYHSSVTTLSGDIILTGGYNTIGDVLNDVWTSSDGGLTWTQMIVNAEWGGRISHTTVSMPDGSVVLMGGMLSASVLANDVWRSVDDGTTWVQMTASAEWTPRYGHSSVAMPDGSIVLTGGIDDFGILWKNDTWRSTDNGATWARLNDGGWWTPRYYHTCVITSDDTIVISGGQDPTGVTNDSWWSINNGVSWITSGRPIPNVSNGDPIILTVPSEALITVTATLWDVKKYGENQKSE